MIDFRNQSRQICYFAVPFLILSILILLNQWRISRPDTALQTGREYLEERFPGAHWDLGKMTPVGDGLAKRWRLEFTTLQKDGRRIQAILLVDRWMPGRIAGKFILLFSPPQIADEEWNRPSFAEQVSSRISRKGIFLIGTLLLALQSLWLCLTRRRGMFRRTDGILLAALGGAAMIILMILEVHPGYMIAYPLIFTFLALTTEPKEGKANGREKE